MNKLHEAGKKVRERIYNLADAEGKLNFADLDMIEETVREVCAEYARTLVLQGKVTLSEEEADIRREVSAEEINNTFDSMIDVFIETINQDLLSLKEKNI